MRQIIEDLPGSKIREVANAAMGRDDVLAFWFGESDEVTPEFIRAAAVALAGRGRDLLLAQPRPGRVARCDGRLHQRAARPVVAERIAITSSGVNALMLAMQLLVGAGDEVVAITPVWPNLPAQPAILGASVVRLRAAPHAGALAARSRRAAAQRHVATPACCSSTRRTIRPAGRSAATSSARCSRIAAAPAPGSSPTRSTSASISSAAPSCAPSFLDIADPDDRLIVVHSFSKSFLMTGWRLGWIVPPPGLGPTVAQADRIQHLVRAGLRAARRPGGLGRGGRLRSRAGRTPAHVPRHPAAAPGGACLASRSPRRPAACMHSSASRAGRFARLRQGSRRRGRASVSRRAWRSARRAKGGCVGASLRATRLG